LNSPTSRVSQRRSGVRFAFGCPRSGVAALSVGRELMRASTLGWVIVTALLPGCTPSTSIEPPSGWTPIDAKKFTFSVPPDVKAMPTFGIDSYVGEYRGDAIAFHFDYGIYSDPLECSSKSGFAERLERIGGKKAKIVSFHNPGSGYPFDEAIAIHFPSAGPKGIKLTVFATCQTQKEYETVRVIFRTIRFK